MKKLDEYNFKKIEVCHLKPSELKSDFGNPRKITKQKLEELKKSIERFDDFGVIVCDENNNIISGNQRIEAMKQLNIDTPILCKKLIGYTDAEKKAINIKANMSSGEFDDDLLQDWIDEINIEIQDIELSNIIENTNNEYNFDKFDKEIKSNTDKEISFLLEKENEKYFLNKLELVNFKNPKKNGEALKKICELL